jgi:hypothetical protein
MAPVKVKNRRDRLKAALRENLKRRKAQAREREAERDQAAVPERSPAGADKRRPD